MNNLTDIAYNYRKENIKLWIFIIAALSSPPGLLFWWLHTKLIAPIDVVVRGLGETLLIAGFIGIFYESLIRKKYEEEMVDTMFKVFEADAGFLKKKKFKDETVNSIIRNCFEAKLCDKELASIFYDSLVSPYVVIENVRETFRYDIKLSKYDTDIEVNSVNFSKDFYFKAVEKLIYTKKLFIQQENTELVVGLCFNDSQLQYYRVQNCIYRTIFRIREEEKQILKTNPLPESIFSLTVKINDVELKTVMTPYDENRGIQIICKYESDEVNTVKKIEFDIEVVTLHDKNVNYYTAYLYDPSFCPEIKLQYNDEMKDIFAITHFTTSLGKDVTSKLDPHMESISVVGKNVWVFPTSGVIFYLESMLIELILWKNEKL